MKDPKYTEWIEQYLDGALSPEETAKFETELAINPDLRKEYDLFNAVEEHFRIEEAMEEMFSDPDLEKAMELVEGWIDEEGKSSLDSQPTPETSD